MSWIGIDPGLSGAVAIIHPDGFVTIRDAPAVEVRKGRDYLVAQMVETLAGTSATLVAIETGIAMPRQSSATTAKQFRGVGLWEGIVSALGYPYELVAPSRWKRDLGLVAGASKGESRALACRLFPSVSDRLARVKDDGRAEALLIAEWARRRG